MYAVLLHIMTIYFLVWLTQFITGSILLEGKHLMATKKTKTVTVDESVALAMDVNGDGHISAEEMAMDLEFKRKSLEDADAMRDAQRNMAWFALFGMLLYPFAVLIAVASGLEKAATILGSMAPTYFVAVAAIVAAFYAKEAMINK
jgi:ABC-type Na+ efflux pump permease subunit